MPAREPVLTAAELAATYARAEETIEALRAHQSEVAWPLVEAARELEARGGKKSLCCTAGTLDLVSLSADLKHAYFAYECSWCGTTPVPGVTVEKLNRTMRHLAQNEEKGA